MNINLDYYKIFYTVAKCNNISDAAAKLFISQPAVSKSIKKLETSTGIQLFYRNSRGVKLTKEGEILLNYVEKAMANLNDGEKVITKLKNKESGLIKIGVSTTLAKHYLVPKLKGYMDLYPKVKIVIINKTAHETLHLIDSGQIDIGIVSNVISYKKYNYKKLTNIQDIFVASSACKEYKKIRKPQDLEKISSLMLLEKHNLSRIFLDEYFKNNFVEVNPMMEIDNMDLLIELTKLNLGISAAIEEFVKDDLDNNKLIKIPITPAIQKRYIVMISNNTIPLSIAGESFWNYLSTY